MEVTKIFDVIPVNFQFPMTFDFRSTRVQNF